MKIALIDYNMGNLGSVAKALSAAGAEFECIRDSAGLDGFSAALLPGVGNFGDGMKNLREGCWVEKLHSFRASGRPVLGICLGMQMMLESSEEAPGEAGLGFFPGHVTRFPAKLAKSGEKIPQIGWNRIALRRPSALLNGIRDGEFFYFVHSYYVPADEDFTLAETGYIVPIASVIGKDNVYGAQFHPEKSQDAGLALLRNFVKIAEETA